MQKSGEKARTEGIEKDLRKTLAIMNICAVYFGHGNLLGWRGSASGRFA
jgi:hypothetical protein